MTYLYLLKHGLRTTSLHMNLDFVFIFQFILLIANRCNVNVFNEYFDFIDFVQINTICCLPIIWHNIPQQIFLTLNLIFFDKLSYINIFSVELYI